MDIFSKSFEPNIKKMLEKRAVEGLIKACGHK